MTTRHDNAQSSSRRPWRRRISNQLAAFAAIMLFASTQVGAPENNLDFDSATSQAASASVLGEIGNSQLELNTTLDQPASDSSHKSTATQKKKAFKFNLFRLRH